jgi:hypothetical protein
MVGKLLLLLAFIAGPAAAQTSAAPDACRPDGTLAKMADLGEASGIAVSRVSGRLWSLNDSGAPVVYALDTSGRVTSRVKLSGATVEDWEAIAVGGCPAGSCVYVADIGDNQANRKQVTVYRLPEPKPGSDSAAIADVFHATYPDGPHDAETLLVTSDGVMLIVTKGETGPIGLYRFPREAKSGSTVRLERVASPAQKTVEPESRITDGGISPDGAWTVLRTKSALAFFRTSDLLAGQWREVKRVPLTSLGEPQGEAVALGAENVVFVAGEGGGKSQPGTFARFACAPAR